MKSYFVLAGRGMISRRECMACLLYTSFLTTHQDDEKYRYAMVGYELGNTLTENGSVARGCCVTDENGLYIAPDTFNVFSIV